MIDDWVFVCSDSRPPRYYYVVKHWPQAINFTKNRIFNHLHLFDRTIPIAQNYIALAKGEKKTQNIQIEECLHKLPKAVFDTINKTKKDQKTIFFSVAIFSGQLFVARYENRLAVEEKRVVQYQINLEPEKFHDNDLLNQIGSKFLVDFVTYKNLKKYTIMIQKEIKRVSTKKWRVKKPSKTASS